MAIAQNHVINIQPGVSAPLVIHCSQGDTGTQINLTVVNGDEEFDCSSYACSVHGTRSDRANWGPVTCNVSGSTVSFSLTSEMTAVAGSCLAEVSIGTVGTANFALLVENATFENGVTYSNDVSVYQNILTAVQTGITNETAERVADVANEKNERVTAIENEKNERVSAVATEKNERVASDNSLSSRISQNDARINNLVGNTGDSNSEIVDARVGADGVTYLSLGEAIRKQLLFSIKAQKLLGYGGSVLSSADDAEPNSIYKCANSESKYWPSNMPINHPTNGFLITITNNIEMTDTQYFWCQLFAYENFEIKFIRNRTDTSGIRTGPWTSWRAVINNEDLAGTNFYFNGPGDNLLKTVHFNNGYVDYGSGGIGTNPDYSYSIIPVDEKQSYKLIVNEADNIHVAFLSGDIYTLGINAYIDGMIVDNDVDFVTPEGCKYIAISIATTKIGICWFNLSSKYVRPSLRFTEKQSVHVTKDGNGDFSKLTDALAYGIKHKNTTIYLDSGTYDIIEELGEDYFSSFKYTAYSNMGPKIGNGTHLICSSKSKIICNYSGTNTEVMQGFSPFNPCYENIAGMGDFIIEGATIEASNIRYIVHDDVGIQIVPYKHEYIGCSMYLDNTGRVQYGIESSHRCLGGGLGIAGTIYVKDCIFDGKEDKDNICVAWHNANYTQSPTGRIIITGNYFRGKNSIEMKSIGTWTDKTPVLISNNHLGKDIVYGSYDGVDNMEILKWNNIVSNA